MIAIIAMLATIRDGWALGGRTPVARMASSKPVGGRIDSMIVFRNLAAMKAIPIHRAAATTLGIAYRISLRSPVAGPEIDSMPRA
jgi:hypothetical protein